MTAGRPEDVGPPPARRVVLGVSGGIAAYKACELLRRFTESGGGRAPGPAAPRPAGRGARPPGGPAGAAAARWGVRGVPGGCAAKEGGVRGGG